LTNKIHIEVIASKIIDISIWYTQSKL
jgi:hypothetical protein